MSWGRQQRSSAGASRETGLAAVARESQQFKRRRQQGAPPIFISEMEVLGHVFNGVKQGESCIQVEYLQSREVVARIQAIKSKQQKAENAGS